MSSRSDLESAILDAEGTMSILEVLEGHLFDSTSEGSKVLVVALVEGRHVFVMTYYEYAALSRVINLLRADLKIVSDTFYAYRP